MEGGVLRGTDVVNKINKIQGCNRQHRVYSPYIHYNNTFVWYVIYRSTKSLCCTPETDLISHLYFN